MLTNQLTEYKNVSGNSGVTHYRVLDSHRAILVVFQGKSAYLYTDEATGVRNINEMVELAESGEGLSGYISKNRVEVYTSFELGPMSVEEQLQQYLPVAA